MDWQALWTIEIVPEAGLKLALSALLGGLVGWEREAHGQAAGFRTFILVAVGSCLIMMVSLHLEEMYRMVGAESAVRVDPGRIASYALAGMGFLGAGAIISGQGNVRGLTTAAGMWMITAVGLAVGSGYFIPAVLATLLSIFILYALRRTKGVFRREVYNTLTLISDDLGGQLKRIEQVIDRYPLSRIQAVSFRRKVRQGTIVFRIRLTSKEDLEWRELTRDLTELPGVREIALEESKFP